MSKTYYISEDSFISYKEHKSKKILPTIVFLHGLRSSTESSKALYLEHFCTELDLPFIAFDALGHGKSSGEFTNQSIDSWLISGEKFLKNLCPYGAILVGSSMGGWVSLLISLRNPDFVKGLVCIAPAQDFTEEMFNSFNDKQREIIKNNGIVSINIGQYTYEISATLINDSKKHLLMNEDKLNINCTVHILQGMHDTEVPYKKSLSIVDKITSPNVKCTLVKQGIHSLSTMDDLALLGRVLIGFLPKSY